MIAHTFESPVKKYAPWIILFLISIFLASCSSKKPQTEAEIVKQEETQSACHAAGTGEKNWNPKAVDKGCKNIDDKNLPCFQAAIAHNYKPTEAGKFCAKLNPEQSDCAIEHMEKNLSLKSIKKKCHF